MKLIVKANKPVTKRRTALARAKKQLDAKKEAEQRAVPAGEYFTEEFKCSATGCDFSLDWYREQAGELFRVRETVRGSEGGNMRKNGHAPSASRKREYALTDFDMSGRVCPYCEYAGPMIYCCCGKTKCGGGIYMKDGEEHCRVAGCCDTPVGGVATHKSGEAQALEYRSAGKPAASKRKSLTGPKRKLIGHDKKPLLPRQ